MTIIDVITIPVGIIGLVAWLVVIGLVAWLVVIKNAVTKLRGGDDG